MELEEQVTLTCEASGDPIPSITWRTSTRNISSEEKVQCHPRVSGPLARGLNANGVYFMPHALGCARGWDAVTHPPAFPGCGLPGIPLQWKGHNSLQGFAGV